MCSKLLRKGLAEVVAMPCKLHCQLTFTLTHSDSLKAKGEGAFPQYDSFWQTMPVEGDDRASSRNNIMLLFCCGCFVCLFASKQASARHLQAPFYTGPPPSPPPTQPLALISHSGRHEISLLFLTRISDVLEAAAKRSSGSRCDVM